MIVKNKLIYIAVAIVGFLAGSFLFDLVQKIF